MKRRPDRFELAFLALVFTSFACQTLTGTKAPATSLPQQTEPAVVAVTATAAPPVSEPSNVDSQGAGILCAGSRTGLSCLDERGWQSYTDQNSNLPNNYLYAGAVCPDGQIAIAHINGVALFDGTTFKQIPELPTTSVAEAVACAQDGSIWVAHFRGVSRYSAGKWITHGAENLASGEFSNDLVYDVEVAPDGRVWVVTSRSVAMFENDAWTLYQEGQGFNGSRFFNALALDANGRPWAAHSNGVDVFENDEWTAIQKPGYDSAASLAIDPNGHVWFGTISSGVHNFGGQAWTQHDRASETVISNHVTSIATDTSGRIWLGTTYGLTVFDGAQWQTLLMQNSGLGDNDIEFVITTKDGPALPIPEEKAAGSLTGRFEKADGTPLADATVQICVETLATNFSGETPCSDQPFFLSTKTNADGDFLFENVPMGYYVIVAETGPGNWAQFVDEFGISSERTLIQAGEAYDVHTLTIEE